MKSKIFSFLIAGSAILAACNNSETAKNDETVAKDTANNTTATTTSNDADLTEEKATFTNVDSKIASSINEVVANYLQVKNALANDNSTEAANSGKTMAASMGKIDPSSLQGEQMNLYKDVAESLKEHAEHMASNAGKIDHQREHLVMMSQDVYDLVKGFGANQTLYVAKCPMANENKGANWLSETKEISNPYMGKKMPKCGTVEKVIKQ